MSENASRGDGTGLLLAFLAGAAAGAAIALLTAPRSGRETREQIKDLAREAADKAKHLPPALGDAYARAAEAARQAFVAAFDEIAAASIPASGEAREGAVVAEAAPLPGPDGRDRDH